MRPLFFFSTNIVFSFLHNYLPTAVLNGGCNFFIYIFLFYIGIERRCVFETRISFQYAC